MCFWEILEICRTVILSPVSSCICNWSPFYFLAYSSSTCPMYHSKPYGCTQVFCLNLAMSCYWTLLCIIFTLRLLLFFIWRVEIMQTHTTSSPQAVYWLIAHNSKPDWIPSLNSQITRLAAHNWQIIGLAFHRLATHRLPLE